MGIDVFHSVEGPNWPKSVGFVSALLALPFLLAWFFYPRNNKKYRLPPGPPTYPIIGNLNVFFDKTRPTHQVVNNLSKVYGPIMLLKVGVQNFVFVSDRELTMELLKGRDQIFDYRPDGLLAAKYSLYGDGHLTMGQPGDYHSYFRRLLMSEMLTGKKLDGFRGLRNEEQTLIVRQVYMASQLNQSMNMRDVLKALTLNVITRMAFGKRFFGLNVNVDDEQKSSHQAWAILIPEIVAGFSKVLAETIHPSLYWIDTLTGVRKEMQSCFKRLDALAQDLVDEHKHRLDALSPEELEEYVPKDFMDIMLIRRVKDNVPHTTTDTSLKAISLDLIVAASDTNATVLEWCLAELIKSPELMKRAQAEIDSVVGYERIVTESDLPNFPFLVALLKETLRLHTPVPWLLPHSCRLDTKVAGYDIPKDSFVNFNVYGMSRNAAYWPDPLKFDPDRFYGKVSNDVEMKGAAFMPFGLGRRICPGILMAHTVTQGTLARLIHSFDWKPSEKDPEVDLRDSSIAVCTKLIPLEAFGTPRLPAHLY